SNRIASTYAHDLAYHSNSAPHRELAHLGIRAGGLGLLSGRRIGYPDHLDLAALARLEPVRKKQ
ncbi:MAG TPA: hypothetical protein VJT50_06550, partial [Pyrinomonadaceae bacterium]|nr:hypothetical protein [Pyrinomonadaceae bacterium]